MALAEQKSYSIDRLSLQGESTHLHIFGGERYLAMGQGAAESLTRSLAEKVTASGFRPDMVVAIVRGGMDPARKIADYLGNLPVLALVMASDYQPDGTRLPPQILQELPDKKEVEEKLRELHRLNPDQTINNVLIVEEVVDNGDSLRLANQHLETKWGLTQKAGQVKIAALAAKDKGLACTQIDYYELHTNDWIIFPWERRETFMALSARWKNYEKPLSDTEIRARFRELGYSETDINWFSSKS